MLKELDTIYLIPKKLFCKNSGCRAEIDIISLFCSSCETQWTSKDYGKYFGVITNVKIEKK